MSYSSAVQSAFGSGFQSIFGLGSYVVPEAVGVLHLDGEPLFFDGELFCFNGLADVSGGLVDPEVGLTLTTEFAPESTLSGPDIADTVPCVLAFDVAGLDGSSGGFIFGVGKNVASGFIGFRADGTLVIRVGSGFGPWSDGSWVDGASYYEIANGSDLVKGDGTLVVEATVNNPNVRAYWNSVSLGAAVPATTGTNWAGSGAGQYLGTLTTGLPTKEDGSLQLVYATASDLRYYENQTLFI